MVIYQHPELSPAIACPYLPDQDLVYEYFFADGLNQGELGWFLARGWRKFGQYFFRPACPDCRACTPLRVDVTRFSPSRSQRRVLRKCQEVRVGFGPIHYCDRLFDLYRTHSRRRFDQDPGFEEFATNLHSPSCPTMLARYELDGRLIAAGYLDRATTALSSVYFVFDPEFSHFSLGIFGALREIEEARRLGLSYYYLGYIVAGCGRMAYKAGFRPHELYSWTDKAWQRADGTGQMDQDCISG